jgi:hypothetical protein
MQTNQPMIPTWNDAPVFRRASTLREVADFLSVDRTFVMKAAAEGHLTVRKLSHKTVRILPQDLIAWLESAARGPAATARAVAEERELVTA